MQEDTYRGDGLNLYAYCANNPVVYYDPSGYAKNLNCPQPTFAETDPDGNVIYYRTMSQEDYNHLVETGQLLGTTETSISPTLSFSQGYDGVTVQFTLKPETTFLLESIGVKQNSKFADQFYPDMPNTYKGWGKSNAQFKAEGNQFNIGLGTGTALNIFNDNIVSISTYNSATNSFTPISKN